MTEEKNISGILNVYKPLGITSHGVVSRVRKLTGIRKVGHTGTLDPEAEGVLPVCIGKATRVAGMLTDADKAYRAEITLGIRTDTQDRTGTVLSRQEVHIKKEEFERVLQEFLGEIKQIPPMYSAVKQNGQPLYKLARQGVEVERKERLIHIDKIEIKKFDGTSGIIEVFCSKGTYIRTLCADIGEALGCGAIMSGLIRIKSGPFCLADAVTLEILESGYQKFLIPPDQLFLEYDAFIADEIQEQKIKNGLPLRRTGCGEGEYFRVYNGKHEFLCISQSVMERDEPLLKMVKGFY